MIFFGKLKNYLVRKLFPYFERYLGIHITPVHYFSPIPNVHLLGDEPFLKPFSCNGIRWNDDRQLDTLKAVEAYNREYVPVENSGLSLLDAAVLYTMIRERKPRMMIEIGSGESTKIALQALKKNRDEGHSFKFVAIEPYPSSSLLLVEDVDFELLVERVQDVELSVFKQADLLFIDSTHVAKIGSDVNYEMFEIVPVLPVGAVVHWHDIPLPMDYWRDWIKSGGQFWNESYVLHAFLMYNDKFPIVWASHYMRIKHLQALKQAAPFFKDGHRISSFWVQKSE